MVAIDNMTPRQVGVLPVLRSYIAHRQDVIVKRSKFDLSKAEKRLHLVEGLIRMVSILDEVVALIRASENKSDAKENLKVSYAFSEEQAEAIVTLQLYRLTNTDIVTLENEQAELEAKILELRAIINDERTLFNLMKRELREVKKKFGKERRSELQDKVETIEIEAQQLIAEEETVVSVTRGGYIKRTSPRSFASSNVEEVGKRDDDELIFVKAGARTTQHLLMFTSLGNVIYRPVHELSDVRWKDIGEHISQTLNNFASDEEIIFAQVLDNFESGENYMVVTAAGQIKQVELASFKPWRTYRSKSMVYGKLKGDKDSIVTLVPIVKGDEDVLLISENGYALRFNISEIPVVGAKAAGVKAMNLKAGDVVKAAFFVQTDSWYLLTQRGFIKRVKSEDIPETSRANRGLQVLRPLKSNPHTVFAAGSVINTEKTPLSETVDLFSPAEAEETQTDKSQILEVTSAVGKVYQTELTDLKLSDRASNGHPLAEDIDRVLEAKIK